jgi:glycosyltransferase involved in cell wall biosynthesis
VVLAPRGEYSPGALSLKPWRKHIYLAAARATGLLRGLLWQATSEDERSRIQAVAGAAPAQVHIAPNLPSASLQQAAAGTPSCATAADDGGPLRLVFLSRISPMKNLDHLLALLRQVRSPLVLSLHGPIGDVAYWQQCQALAAALPAHVRMQYLGDVPPDQVAEVFGQHALFVFPTRGENFGHVILESLSAGTPVIVSDRTPWRADADGGLTVLPLDNTQAWAAAIDSFAQVGAEVRRQRRAAAHAVARAHLQRSPALAGHRALFQAALGQAAAGG